MLEALNSGAFAWPLALTCVSIAVAGWARGMALRARLNRALHEVRRPLQALALSVPHDAARGPDQLELALAALTDLDRQLNGGRPGPRQTVDARSLVERAVERWRSEAAMARRPLRLSWRANGSVVVCDPAAIGRALDNLIANSLEHGRGTITVEAAVRTRRLRLVVADGGTARVPPGRRVRVARRSGLAWRWGDPRRGHGLRVVADVAASHGGRFAACRHPGGATAVLELPLARR